MTKILCFVSCQPYSPVAGVPKFQRGQVWKVLCGVRSNSKSKRLDGPVNLSGSLNFTDSQAEQFDDLYKANTSFLHAILIDLGKMLALFVLIIFAIMYSSLDPLPLASVHIFFFFSHLPVPTCILALLSACRLLIANYTRYQESCRSGHFPWCNIISILRNRWFCGEELYVNQHYWSQFGYV